jgi:hypothetical protein
MHLMLFRQTAGDLDRVAFRPADGDVSPDEYGNFYVNRVLCAKTLSTVIS